MLHAALALFAALAEPGALRWEAWDRLPKAPGEAIAYGRSGSCAGMAGGSLVVLGGSSFPEPGLTVTRGGTKHQYRDALIRDMASGRWRAQPDVLAMGTELALSLPSGDGFLCIGGSSAAGPLAGGVRVKLQGGTVALEALPALPIPAANPVGAAIDGRIFVVAGSRLFELAAGAWHERVPVPWSERVDFAAVGAGGRLYVMGGCTRTPQGWQVHRALFAYESAADRWTRLADMPIALSSLGAVALSSAGFHIIGGADADASARFAAAADAVARATPGSPEEAQRKAEQTALFDHDPGFSPAIYRYDIAANAWRFAGWHPGPAAIKRPAVPFEGGLLLVGGETNAGKRTAAIWRVTLDSR